MDVFDSFCSLSKQIFNLALKDAVMLDIQVVVEISVLKLRHYVYVIIVNVQIFIFNNIWMAKTI